MIQVNLQNKQEIQISAKHTLQNGVAYNITKLPDKIDEKCNDMEGLS